MMTINEVCTALYALQLKEYEDYQVNCEVYGEHSYDAEGSFHRFDTLQKAREMLEELL